MEYGTPNANLVNDGAVCEPILCIFTQSPESRHAIQCERVRFDQLMVEPLPGSLQVGTRWCFLNELRALDDGRYAMERSNIVLR